MTDLSTELDAEQLLALLIQAAGNADAVRLSGLVNVGAAASPNPAEFTFTRTALVDMWSQLYRQHLTMPPNRRPEQRVNRSLPVLIGVTAVASVGGPDLRVNDGEILGFLAERVYLAEALDAQHPMSNTLPVGDSVRQAATDLIMGVTPPPPGEEDPPQQ